MATGSETTMQTKNANPPIRLTGRHLIMTEAMEDYFRHCLSRLAHEPLFRLVSPR